jgi:ABC-type multidrug transport system permease subunit
MRRRPHQQPGLAKTLAQFEGTDMTFLWILAGIVYIACWIYFGLTTFRKGHYWMFWIGFFIPILWIIGALISPTQRAAARAAASGA